MMQYYENQVCKLALQFREYEGQKKNKGSQYQERKASGSKKKCGWKCTNDSNECVSELDIDCMFIENKWIISITQQKSEHVHPPLKDDDECNNWVTLLHRKAQECNFDMVTIGFKCDIWHDEDDSHDTFQCHPKFHSHPWESHGWYDFATVTFEDELTEGEYKSCVKVLLFSNFSYSTNSSCVNKYTVIQPLASIPPLPKHQTMPWLYADYLSPNLMVV